MSDTPFKVRKTASINDLAEAAPAQASDNFRSVKVISMTFNMPEDWHTRFKMEAVKRGISMKELFEECWDLYRAQNR